MMKKFLVLVMAVMLNCSSAWAENNLLDYDWWRHATVADVKKEIANGADVNAKDSNGDAVLIHAVKSYKKPEIIKILVDAGADVNAKDKLGRTALMWAIYSNNTEIVKALIDVGADVNAKDNDGETTLMWAIYSDNTEIVKALIDAVADVNVKDNDGETAWYKVTLGK